MSRLSTLIELARNGKQFKRSLANESSSRISVHTRGAILGPRSSNEPSVKQVETFPRQEEAVLSELLELSGRDSVFLLSRLGEQILYGDTRKLEEVLRRMQKKGVVVLEKDAEGEWGARLTLKGAIVALYGNWLLEESHGDEEPGLLQIQPPSIAFKSQRHA